jgi:DNA-binding MarR family transcriptional regulator
MLVPDLPAVITTVKTDSKIITDMFKTVSLGTPENAVGFVLWRIAGRYQREADRALASIGLTNLQFVILTLVAWQGRSGEPVTQAELARFGGIHPMQVSQTVKFLERKSFVLRQRSSSDTRANDLEVTRTGLSVLRKALPAMIEVQSRLFGEAGRPGGSLLTMLLRLEKEQVSALSKYPSDL